MLLYNIECIAPPRKNPRSNVPWIYTQRVFSVCFRKYTVSQKKTRHPTHVDNFAKK